MGESQERSWDRALQAFTFSLSECVLKKQSHEVFLNQPAFMSCSKEASRMLIIFSHIFLPPSQNSLMRFILPISLRGNMGR